MATQYTPHLGLPYWQAGDKNWHVQYAAACGILDGMEALFNLLVVPAEAAVTPGAAAASLDIAVFPGSTVLSTGAVLDYAGTSSFAMTASITNYVWLTEGGTLTKGTAWPTTTFVTRLATVVAGTTTLTSITPARIPTASAGGLLAFLALTGGTFNDTSAVVQLLTGTTHGVQWGSAASQLQAWWGATPVVQPSGSGQAALAAAVASALTNSTTGTASSTIGDVGSSFSQATLNNIHASLLAQINDLMTDRDNNRTLLMAIRSALVTIGKIKGSA